VKGTWKESCYTGNSESYIRHVKEGFGNGASNSSNRLHKGNMERGSYTEDSEKHVMEGSGNRVSLL